VKIAYHRHHQIKEYGSLTMKLKVLLENQPPSEFGDLAAAFTRAKHEALAFVSKVEDDDAPASSGPKKGARRGKHIYFLNS